MPHLALVNDRPERELILEMTVPGEPLPWQRASRSGHRSYKPAKILNHERTIELMTLAAGVRNPTRRPVILDVDFFMGNQRRCDLDNLVKTVGDALNGAAWVDDSQIIALFAAKLVDRDRPRTELRVWAVAE